jgi:hypothetical protein
MGAVQRTSAGRRRDRGEEDRQGGELRDEEVVVDRIPSLRAGRPLLKERNLRTANGAHESPVSGLHVISVVRKIRPGRPRIGASSRSACGADAVGPAVDARGCGRRRCAVRSRRIWANVSRNVTAVAATSRSVVSRSGWSWRMVFSVTGWDRLGVWWNAASPRRARPRWHRWRRCPRGHTGPI